jgi:hypothetical protein
MEFFSKKRKYVLLLQLLHLLFLLRSHFFQLEYMQLQEILELQIEMS